MNDLRPLWLRSIYVKGQCYCLYKSFKLIQVRRERSLFLLESYGGQALKPHLPQSKVPSSTRVIA